MDEKIAGLVANILSDVKCLRETREDAGEVLGIEIMALNAVVNAAKYLKEKKATE